MIPEEYNLLVLHVLSSTVIPHRNPKYKRVFNICKQRKGRQTWLKRSFWYHGLSFVESIAMSMNLREVTFSQRHPLTFYRTRGGEPRFVIVKSNQDDVDRHGSSVSSSLLFLPLTDALMINSKCWKYVPLKVMNMCKLLEYYVFKHLLILFSITEVSMRVHNINMPPDVLLKLWAFICCLTLSTNTTYIWSLFTHHSFWNPTQTHVTISVSQGKTVSRLSQIALPAPFPHCMMHMDVTVGVGPEKIMYPSEPAALWGMEEGRKRL